MKIQTAPTQSFSERAPSFDYRISMNTKAPINPPSQHKSYIHVIVDAFSHFVVTVPIKSNAKTAVKTLLHRWITKIGPPIYLVTDRGSEYINNAMAHLCTLMGNRHSPRHSLFSLDKWSCRSTKQKAWHTPTNVSPRHSKRMGNPSSHVCLRSQLSTSFRTQCFSSRNWSSHATQNTTHLCFKPKPKHIKTMYFKILLSTSRTFTI